MSQPGIVPYHYVKYTFTCMLHQMKGCVVTALACSMQLLFCMVSLQVPVLLLVRLPAGVS